MWQNLRDNSGFGWDSVLEVPTAPDDVWDRYLAAHPKARAFRFSTLPDLHLAEMLFSGQTATGSFAVSNENSDSYLVGDVVDSESGCEFDKPLSSDDNEDAALAAGSDLEDDNDVDAINSSRRRLHSRPTTVVTPSRTVIKQLSRVTSPIVRAH